MRRLLCLVLLWGCACGTASTRPPIPLSILSIDPAVQDSASSQVVTVRMNQEPSFRVDYGEGSARRLGHWTLWVADQQVPLDTYLGHGSFQGTIPAGLNTGSYDIKVTTEGGEATTLAAAYEVRPPGSAVGFYLESIDDQKQGQPFTVTVHAAGTGASLFMDTVTLTLYMGGTRISEPMRTPPFSEGKQTMEFTLSTAGTNYLVVVNDGEASSAVSNAFRVDP